MKRRGTNATKHATGQAEAEFFLGYYYRTVEEHINAFATQPGCPYSVTDVALRVGRLLEAKALREAPGHTQLVPEVRQNGAGTKMPRGPLLTAGEEVHVRPRHHRTLSKDALGRIAEAQRKRWRKQKREERANHKRVLTSKQLRAMRANAVKARQAHLAKHSGHRSTVRAKSTAVTCRLCKRPFPNRSEYMKHYNSDHPRQVAARVAAIRRAKQLEAAA